MKLVTNLIATFIVIFITGAAIYSVETGKLPRFNIPSIKIPKIAIKTSFTKPRPTAIPTAIPTSKPARVMTSAPIPPTYFKLVRSYASPNGRYIITAIQNKAGNDDCEYYFEGSHNLKLHEIIREQKKNCLNNFGTLGTPIVGFANENVLLFKNSENELRIIDIPNATSSSYLVDKPLKFIAVDKTLNYWLLKNAEQKRYELKDLNKKDVIENVRAIADPDGFNVSEVYYDFQNNGFVFASERSADRENTGLIDNEVKFDFFSLSTLSLRNLLITEKAEIIATECSPGGLNSLPGEIIFRSGCVVINPKYLDAERQIHIKL